MAMATDRLWWRAQRRVDRWLHAGLPSERPEGWRYRSELTILMAKWWTLGTGLFWALQVAVPGPVKRFLFETREAEWIERHLCTLSIHNNFGPHGCGWTISVIPGIDFYSTDPVFGATFGNTFWILILAVFTTFAHADWRHYLRRLAMERLVRSAGLI